MKSNLTKGKNNMRYEQKAELQDSNKARMYEAKKKARIYAEKKNKNNVLIAKMYEEKKKQKHKQIIIKNHQYEINADGTETDIERYGKGEINE